MKDKEKSYHEENVLHLLRVGHKFYTDEKGRKYYKVPSSIRINNRMLVSERLISKLKTQLSNER